MRPFGKGANGLTDMADRDIDDVVAYIRHWSTVAPSPMTRPMTPTPQESTTARATPAPPND